MGWSHSEMGDCKECKTKGSVEFTSWGDKSFEGEGHQCLECGKYEGGSWYNGEEEDWDFWVSKGYEDCVQPYVEGFLTLKEVNDLRESLEYYPLNDLRKVVN